MHRKALDEKGRFDGSRSCRLGSCGPVRAATSEDLDWRGYVHGTGDTCKRQLWLLERGTGGDLADLRVRCQCGKSRRMAEAAELGLKALGNCWGGRPWLGAVARSHAASRADC